MSDLDMTEARRAVFWSRVDTSAECWIWTGCRFKTGYGGFSVNSVPRYAHRISWQMANGPIPKGMHICHKCDNPACVNPAHLFLGTHRQNMADMVAKGRHYSPFTAAERARWGAPKCGPFFVSRASKQLPLGKRGAS